MRTTGSSTALRLMIGQPRPDAITGGLMSHKIKPSTVPVVRSATGGTRLASELRAGRQGPAGRPAIDRLPVASAAVRGQRARFPLSAPGSTITRADGIAFTGR